MAYCDYQHCFVCDAKAFYDANIDWEYQNCNVGDVYVLCKECAKTHHFELVAKDQSAADAGRGK